MTNHVIHTQYLRSNYVIVGNRNIGLDNFVIIYFSYFIYPSIMLISTKWMGHKEHNE